MIKHICSNCNFELIVGNMAIECDNCRAIIYTYPGVYVHVKVNMPPPKAKSHEEVMLLHKQLADMRARISELEKQLDYYRKQYLPSMYPPQRLGPNMIGPNTLGPNTLGPNTLGPNTLGPNTLGLSWQYFGGVSSVDIRSDAYQKAVEQANRAIEAAIRNSPAADE